MEKIKSISKHTVNTGCQRTIIYCDYFVTLYANINVLPRMPGLSSYIVVSRKLMTIEQFCYLC